MSYEQHQKSGGSLSARCAVVTLSDTRTEATDNSGARVRELLSASGHSIVHYEVIPDDPTRLDSLLSALLLRDDVELIVTNGGTGVSRRDNTIPVVTRYLHLPLPGFGELFRMLSYEQIGSGAMLSRAVGGVTGASRNKLLFALPGSTKAVELAMTRLILPELGHMLAELRK
jgi:molybdenum cofactor biosynthesis protein B